MNDRSTHRLAIDAHVSPDESTQSLKTAGFEITKPLLVRRSDHWRRQAAGFYTAGERIKCWGGSGAFWRGFWGLLFDVNRIFSARSTRSGFNARAHGGRTDSEVGV